MFNFSLDSVRVFQCWRLAEPYRRKMMLARVAATHTRMNRQVQTMSSSTRLAMMEGVCGTREPPPG